MILLIDNYDSFTYNLVDYLYQLNVDVKVFRNSEPVHRITKQDYQGLILSPGPGIPETSGNIMKVISHYSESLPILGICLGHQAIGSVYGASLSKANRPMHGKISVISVTDDYLFEGLPQQFNIVRYHSLILRNLPSSLQTIGKTINGEIMAIKHRKLNIRGLQFHPEAYMTEYGYTILSNWIKKI